MIFSRSVEYAVVALGHLADAPEGSRRTARQIAEEDGVPAFFLAKTLQTLARQGMLTSTKGPTGGFGLAKPATRIRLIDVVAALDGTDDVERMPAGLPNYKQLRASILSYLKETTIADVAAQRVKDRKRAQRKAATKG